MIKTNVKLKALFIALMMGGAMSTMTGCSSLAIGESEFQCQAEEGGVACVSAREVYQKTHTKDELTDEDTPSSRVLKKENEGTALGYFDSSDEKKEKEAINPTVNYSGISGTVYDSQNEVIQGYIEGKDTIELYRHSESKIEELKEKHADGTYIEPNLMRQPAQVMRVWIGPREDELENFHKDKEVYVEIEPKKWLLGDKIKFERPVIRPLLRESSTMNQSYNGANAGKMPPVNSFKQPSTPVMDSKYQQWK